MTNIKRLPPTVKTPPKEFPTAKAACEWLAQALGVRIVTKSAWGGWIQVLGDQPFCSETKIKGYGGVYDLLAANFKEQYGREAPDAQRW